jgi:hypothetical protein
MKGWRESRARPARARWTALLAWGALGALLAAVPADAQTPSNPFCLKPNEETPEIYGPTDIGATLAGRRLSVAENGEGTLTVLRWPSRSYYEQLKYYTVDRDLPRLGLSPNEGAFSGLALRMRGGRREFVWLRDLHSVQRYASDNSDTVYTRYRSRRLGLRLEITDVVPSRGDVLMRRHLLRLDEGSLVRRARLIAFANLNPTASKRPLLPTEDWCEENRGTDMAEYDPGSDAIVYSISEIDESTLRPSSVAVAIGASRPSVDHQIGADRYTGDPSAVSGPESAYDDAADGRLSGGDGLGPAEVDAALEVPIGRRPVTVTFAAGPDAAAATTLLDRYRRRSAAREARRKRRSYLRWLADAPLPRDAPPPVERLAKRALISLRQAIDLQAGPDGTDVAIVASLATQSPYYLDWIRDGSFLNEALDVIGHHHLVTRHERFYVDAQHTLKEGAPPGSPLSACEEPTPAGNWFMTNYADGGDAGVFTWEIDETGFGAWTLWRHYRYLRRAGKDAAATSYLDEVYPAIRNAADFLVAFRDPDTKLPPGTACEDDNYPHSGQPTMQSAGPALLAMRSAEAAARRLGEMADADRFEARRLELEQAIDQHYQAKGGAWTSDYGNGGWALWPEKVKPYDDPRSRAQAELDWQAVRPSFRAPAGSRTRGAYEAKALLGMAHLYRATGSPKMRRVRRGLEWIAEVEAGYQRTGILGEAWYVRDGRLISVVSQPHIWEQVLFYLTALQGYGREPYGSHPPSHDRAGR